MTGKQPQRGRTFARIAAVQALFQIEQAGDRADVVIDQFQRHRLTAFAELGPDEGSLPEADKVLFARIVRGATLNAERIDDLIGGALPTEWPLGRLDAVLRGLLRAAAGELADEQGAPSKVIINEYLDVAHGFFNGDEPKLANGLLDRLAHELRAGEFA